MNVPSLRDRALAAARHLPALPQSATQVLGMLASSDVDLRRVAQVVEKDPVLATRVLCVANSGAFGRGRNIADIRHAVTMLGIGPLRAYAIGWTVLSVFNRMRTPKFWDHKGFVAHSVATASLTDQLVDAFAHPHRGEGYVSGLVHDMGKLIFAVYLPDDYSRVITTARVADRPVRELELDLIGIDHAELSAIAAHHWNLPESVCTAIRYHHSPWADVSSDVPLSMVICRADAFINVSQPPLDETEEMPSESLDFPGFQAEARNALLSFWSMWPMMRSLLA